jgi:hypothetical protein
MCGAIPSPQNVFMVWCLVKHRDNLPLPNHTADVKVTIYERVAKQKSFPVAVLSDSGSPIGVLR